MTANTKLTAIYEERPNGSYIAYVEEIPGVNTQGDTLEEAKSNLREALEMILEARRELTEKEIGSRSVIRETIELAA
jgi:predicted RNase H-like HicB family nuclease